MTAVFALMLAILAIGMFAGLRGERRARLLLAAVILAMVLYEMVSLARI